MVGVTVFVREEVGVKEGDCVEVRVIDGVCVDVDVLEGVCEATGVRLLLRLGV